MNSNVINIATTSWPPPYKLRYSSRAKHISLKIHHLTGLEVVVPERKKNFNPEPFLLEKKSWIKKHWKIITAAQDSEQITELPKTIFITMNNSKWHLIYVEQPGKKLKLNINKSINILIFIGEINFLSVKRKLISWLKTIAYEQLSYRMNLLSDSTNLSYNKISIRQQKTLWGSCTHNKDISLNLKLIFLPLALTDYVLLHELCHTKYLSHGKRFWQLVSKYNHNYKFIEKQLREADNYIPNWVLN